MNQYIVNLHSEPREPSQLEGKPFLTLFDTFSCETESLGQGIRLSHLLVWVRLCRRYPVFRVRCKKFSFDIPGHSLHHRHDPWTLRHERQQVFIITEFLAGEIWRKIPTLVWSLTRLLHLYGSFHRSVRHICHFSSSPINPEAVCLTTGELFSLCPPLLHTQEQKVP